MLQLHKKNYIYLYFKKDRQNISDHYPIISTEQKIGLAFEY